MPSSTSPDDRVAASREDQELLARLQRGDDGALDAIFRRWYAPLVRAVEAILRDRAVAEEIVQDAMLELWRRRESINPDGSAQSYLYKATRNRALNHLRHLKVELDNAASMDREPAREPSAPSTLVAREMQEALRSGLNALPPRCREVFELSRQGGMKYTEIAEVMEISVKTVEAQMGKALRTLREHLAPWLPDGDCL